MKTKKIKRRSRKNPVDLPSQVRSRPRWLQNKLPEFKYYGEPAGLMQPSLGVDVTHLGIYPPKKIPENTNKAFELGRLLGFKRGLDCKHIKYAENIYKLLLRDISADEYFNNIFPEIDKYEAFRSGVIFGVKYAIQYCGITKILQRRQELQKINRELQQNFWEYL